MKPPRFFARAPWRDWLALALLLALAVAFLHRTVLGNLVMVDLDVFTYFYPYKAFVAEAIRSASLPLWNPYLFMGVPLLANIQSAVLYPLNLPLSWLSAPKMVSTSILIHIFLAAAFSYGFARRVLRLAPWGALVSALTLGFSGFLGAQSGHVNQLSSLAWLPLLLWLFFLAFTKHRVAYLVLASVVVALQFLAGHIQSSYINLLALGCYAVYLPLEGHRQPVGATSDRKALARAAARSVGLLTLIVSLGTALVAVQLVPTLELSSLSIRSAGLPYREAVSFSLDPTIMHRSLLPSLGDSPFSEYVAYVGIIPLFLAVLGAYRGRGEPSVRFLVALALLGIFLALGVYNPLFYFLYRLAPGFALFRVPARWLYLYVFGMSFLAGRGVQELTLLSTELGLPPMKWLATVLSPAAIVLLLTALHPPAAGIVVYWVAWGVLGGLLLWFGLRRQRGLPYLALVSSLVVLELLLASRYQPYNRVTAPQAFSSMRSSIAHLLTDGGTYRFFSFSDGSFDPGDLGAVQEILGDQLPEQSVYDYLVATKQKEVLTPNLPLLYQLQSVDGYDGGILPPARYVQWQQLFLPAELVSADGRLQGRITEIPDSRLLNMHNVRYVLTDKVYDVWVDGAYYDLGHRAVLGDDAARELTLDDLPAFPATALGIVSYLTEAPDLPQGAPVAEVTVTDVAGRQVSFLLRAGEDTAEGQYSAASPVHQQPRVVGHWREDPTGNDYYALLEWGETQRIQSIGVRWLGDQGGLRVRGMTLLDQRTGTHRSLIVSTEGRYRLTHSGDVKIYENLDVMPRAYMVHQARFLPDDEETIATLQSKDFDPRFQVLLSGEALSQDWFGTHCENEVELLSYAEERVSVQVETACPGYLVLTDAYYPGWVARVDGRPQAIERANLHFRAVFVDEGQHLVEFVYDPPSLKIGACTSLLAALLPVGVLAWGRLSWRRDRAQALRKQWHDHWAHLCRETVDM